MNQHRLGWVLVLFQFTLLIAIVLSPQGDLWPVDQYLGGFASALIVFGLIIVLLGLFGLGSSLTASPVPKKHSELKTLGIYAYARHPIYTGLTVFSIGFAIAGASLWKISLTVILMLLLTIKARFEEKMLASKFPDYYSYQKSVGMFFPRLRKSK